MAGRNRFTARPARQAYHQKATRCARCCMAAEIRRRTTSPNFIANSTSLKANTRSRAMRSARASSRRHPGEFGNRSASQRIQPDGHPR